MDLFNINPSHFFSTFSKIKSTSIIESDSVPNNLFIFPVIIFNRNTMINDLGDIDYDSSKNTNNILKDNKLTIQGERFLYKKFFSPLPTFVDISNLTKLKTTTIQEPNISKLINKKDEKDIGIRFVKLDENHMIAFFNGVIGSRSENINYVKNGLLFLKSYWDLIKKQKISVLKDRKIFFRKYYL